MLLLANGITAIEAVITMPLTGVWHADLSADTDDAAKLTGAITLSLDGGPTLKGFARRTKAYLGRVGVRMVGGRGGLARIVDGLHYRGVPARIPAMDIAADAGEELDASSTIDSEFAHWTRVRAEAGMQLASLAKALGMPWRLTLDGKILIRDIEWKDAKVRQLEIVNRNASDGHLSIGSWLEPGTIVLGERVTRTVVRIGGDGLSTQVWVDDVRDE